MKYLYATAAAFVLSVTLTAQTIYPGCIDGTIYFKVHDTSSVQLVPYNNDVPQFNQLITKYGIDSIYKAFRTPDSLLQNIYRLNFTQASNIDSLIIEMQQVYFVEFAEKVDICIADFIPNDLQSNQWYLPRIDAPLAWNITTGLPSVVIAIVDNAVKTTHPDLAPNMWVNPGEIPNNGFDDDLNGYVDDVNGYDVADNDNNPNPPPNTSIGSPFNHGTHCAGIASAATNNGIGIAALGYNVRIMAVKCSPDTSAGNQLTSSYEGVDYAISAGADIISMSFGSSNPPFTGQLLMNAARARGIVLVAAAGNAGSSNAYYPAAFTNVIAVGATNQQDQKASFSNYGSYIDVMAPGVTIYSTIAGSNSYGNLNGTSMACPLVAGLAGLIRSKNSALTPANIESLIEAGCEDIYAQNPGYLGQLGAGRINAYNSLSLAPVSLTETLAPNGFTVAPNPANGSFRVLLPRELQGQVELRIINMLGQVIYEQQVNSGIAEVQHAFTQDGIYLVEISQQGRVAGRTKIMIRQ